MKANVGTLDRAGRVLLGLALVALAFSGKIGAWGWIGIIPLATGLFGFCPLYRVFGMSTCPLPSAKR